MITIGQSFGLHDRYTIVSELGAGGMSFVYKAYDTMLKEDVAIKVLQNKFSQNEDVKSRFLNEAKICLTLAHPNIIRVRDINIFEDNYYMVMEYIEGVELKEIQESFKDVNPFEVYNFLKPILEALAYAHKYTVHRDIKPSNIMVKKDSVYLMDFGISKALDASELSNHTIIGGMGTRKYASPEQTFNANDVDMRSDMYSMGIIFYELLTGITPKNTAVVEAQSPSVLVESIPLVISNIILKMIEPRVENRFNRMEDVIDAFERAKDISIKSDNNQKKVTPFIKKENNDLELVFIEAGDFLRGSGIESKNPIEKPRKKIFLDNFYISKYCVSNEEYNVFIETLNKEKPKDFDINLKLKPQHPVVNVSFDDALAYCEFVNATLPTEAQWEKAAKGKGNFIYPWGNEFDPKKANINYIFDDTVDIYNYEEGQTQSGIFQMAGNVWEWCLDDFIEDFYSSDIISNPCAKKDNTTKVIRGGSFDFASNGARNSFRFSSNKDSVQNNIGFRIVVNNEKY